MESIYADRVKTYGRHWYRPWSALLVVLMVFTGFSWLTRGTRRQAEFSRENLPESRYRASVEIDGLLWTGDIGIALPRARRNGRRVLVAFHGITDFNGRSNELTVFRNQSVQSALDGYILVMLYCDMVPAHFYQNEPDPDVQRRDGEANYKFEQERFQTVQIPLYVVLQPKAQSGFDVVAEYGEAKINDLNEFVRFLRNSGSK